MKWAAPQFFFLALTLIPVAIYLIFFRADHIPTLTVSTFKAFGELVAKSAFKTQTLALGALRVVGLALLILALARPQKGLKSEELTAKATDIMICLDASRSMLTIDFKPENRFAVAKTVIKDFIKGRDQDRLGLVVFAENAITQCPLTFDKSALLSIIDQLEVGVVPPDQTAIGLGIATSVNRLKNSAAKSKVLILVTDGANNAGNVDPITSAKAAGAFGIKIYTIGVGSPEGGDMPINHPVYGQQMVHVKSDLDEDMLLKIATETNGKYFRAKSAGALKTIFSDIDSLEKTDIKTTEYVDYEELYVGFLLAGFFLLCVEFTLAKTLWRTAP